MQREAPRAVFFGSLGVLAEFGELKRRAANVAFQEAGLAWSWTPATWAALDDLPDLRRRLADFAAAREESVNVQALEARARAIFLAMVPEVQIPLRPGVAETLAAARRAGVRVALLTGANAYEADLLLASVRPETGLGAFDYVGHGGLGAADPHRHALSVLRLEPHEALAIESRPAGAAAAGAAGIPCVAVPGTFHRGRGFPAGVRRAEALSPALLGLTVPAPGALTA